MPAHLQNHHRQAKCERDPESPSHVGKLGIWTGIRARYVRFERDAEDRTIAGAGLTDLWMHWAGVDGAFRHWRRRFCLLADIGRGIGDEFGFAPLATEIIGVTAVFGGLLGAAGIDIHAANRIFFQMRGLANIT